MCSGVICQLGNKISTGANKKYKILMNPHFSVRSFSAALAFFFLFFMQTADPPRVTAHPQGAKDVVPGQPITFTVETTGTEPLNYQWQWKPAGEEGGSEEWQLCDMESSDGTILTIPSVQKLNEGSYQCVVSNCAGSQISKVAKLSIGKKQDIIRTNSHFKISYILFSISLYS